MELNPTNPFVRFLTDTSWHSAYSPQLEYHLAHPEEPFGYTLCDMSKEVAAYVIGLFGFGFLFAWIFVTGPISYILWAVDPSLYPFPVLLGAQGYPAAGMFIFLPMGFLTLSVIALAAWGACHLFGKYVLRFIHLPRWKIIPDWAHETMDAVSGRLCPFVTVKSNVSKNTTD